MDAGKIEENGSEKNFGGGKDLGGKGGLTHIAEPLRSLAVPIADLNLDVANARRHPEKNMAAIVATTTG